jgi:hypothetical protein
MKNRTAKTTTITTTMTSTMFVSVIGVLCNGQDNQPRRAYSLAAFVILAT